MNEDAYIKVRTKVEILRKTCEQKSFWICYCIKSDLEHILPYQCQQNFEDDCKEQLAMEMQKLDSEM